MICKYHIYIYLAQVLEICTFFLIFEVFQWYLKNQHPNIDGSSSADSLCDRPRGNSKASTQLPEETAKEPAAATGKSSKALHLCPVTAVQKKKSTTVNKNNNNNNN